MSHTHGLSDPGASDNNQASREDFPIPSDPTLMGSWALEQEQQQAPASGSLQHMWDAAIDPLWQQNMGWTPRNPGDDDLRPGNPTLAHLELFRLAPHAPLSQTVPHFSGNEIYQKRGKAIDPSEGEERGVGNNLWPYPNPPPQEWYSGQISHTPNAAQHTAQRHPSRPRTPKCGQEVHIPRASQNDEIAALLQEEVEKPFKCDKCPARFARKRDCERHRRSVHTGSKVYHCKGCGEGFVRSDGRGRHWKLSPECHQSHINSSYCSPST